MKVKRLLSSLHTIILDVNHVSVNLSNRLAADSVAAHFTLLVVTWMFVLAGCCLSRIASLILTAAVVLTQLVTAYARACKANKNRNKLAKVEVKRQRSRCLICCKGTIFFRIQCANEKMTRVGSQKFEKKIWRIGINQLTMTKPWKTANKDHKNRNKKGFMDTNQRLIYNTELCGNVNIVASELACAWHFNLNNELTLMGLQWFTIWELRGLYNQIS